MHALGKMRIKIRAFQRAFFFYKVMVKIHSLFGKGKPVMKRLEKRMRPNKEITQMPYCRV